MLLKDKMTSITLTRVEQDIVDYLLSHQSLLHKLSTRDIAKKVYCSSSALIRLAHKLGFQGYSQLKEQLIKEQEYLDSHFDHIDANIPFTEDETMMGVVGSVYQVIQEAMNDTISLLHHDSLQKAVKIINQSQHIYIFSFSSYISLATVFQQKMSRVHKHVIVQSCPGEDNYQVDMMNKNDCAIIISYSGENQTLLSASRLIKQKNIPIIVITSLGENTLSHDGEVVLYMSTREKLFSKIANYTSEHSVSLLFDILYSCYFRLKYQKNLEHKIHYSKSVEQEHFSLNQMIKE